MKTLNEVIKACEICRQSISPFDEKCKECPYHEEDENGNWLSSYCGDFHFDVLYYLKDYLRYQNTPSRIGHMALVDYFDELQKNEPLTWDELKTMVGKPVWVVVDGKERWRIIEEVSSEHLILESGLPLHRCWINHPDGWQAYRKERKNETD